MIRPFSAIAFCVLLLGCTALPTADERKQQTEHLVAVQNWTGGVLKTGPFDLMAYWPKRQVQATDLTIYIEGDGFAWITSSQPSSDPTPRDPLALRLAMAQPTGNVAYLGRPCQYMGAQRTGCPQRYWSDARFAQEVLDASSRAVDALKERFGAKQLTLVGYSGGGAVATLLAEHRLDVVRLITVAGNLDHAAWTRHHRIHPLSGSLNPADGINGLAQVKQWHFVGENDKVIPPVLAQEFAERFPRSHRPPVLVEPGFDHHCCWVEHWPTLWARVSFFFVLDGN